ncbi:MAG: LPD38 domain-containing protein [Planctomycetota bacterium]
MRALKPEERKQWRDLTVDDMQKEMEYEQSFAGQIEEVQGEKLDRGAIEFWDMVEGNPASRAVVRLGASTFKGLGAAVSSIGTKAKILSDAELTPPEPTGNEVLDTKRMRVYENLKNRKTAKFMEPLVDDVEAVLLQVSRNRELGQKMMEMADNAPKYKDAASIKSTLEAEGFMDTLKEGTGLVANTIIDSFGIMLPAMAAGTDPATFLAGMQSIHSGLQQEAAKQQDVELSMTDQELSGLVQAALGMAAGPEAWAVGRSGAQFVEQMLKSGFKDIGRKAVVGMGLEGATEFAQEWVNQQLPEWTDDNKGFWQNLDDDQQKEILAGAVLAPLAAGPFEVVGAVKARRVDRMKGVQALAELPPEEQQQVVEELPEGAQKAALERVTTTPERRGAKRKLTLPPDRPITQDVIDKMRFDMAPEFLAGDEARTEEFVKQGYAVPKTDEEAAAQTAANQAIHKELYGVAPIRVETTSEAGVRVLDAVRRHTLKAADKAEEDGKLQKAAGYRLVAEKGDLRLVEPTDAPEHEWMREQQAYADSLGTTLVFYDADGPLASGGMFTQEGVVAVRYKPKGYAAAGASVMLHELIHNMDKRTPSASQALAGLIQETFPEEWAEVEAEVAAIEEETGWKQVESEKLAYFSQRYARDIFGTMAAIAENPKLAEESRGLRKAYERFVDAIVDLLTKVPKLAEFFGVTPQEIRDNNLAVAKVAKSFAEALGGEAAVGVQPKIETKPVTKEEARKKAEKKAAKPKISGTRAIDLKPGDAIQITKAIGGVVKKVGKVAKDGSVSVELESGEAHVLMQDTLVKKLEPTAAPAAEATPAKDTYWHFSTGDRTDTGLLREFAGTGAAGREASRFRKVKGKLDPESAAIHLYLPGAMAERKVTGKATHVVRVQSKLNLMDTASKESVELAQKLQEQGLYGEEHIEAYIKEIKARGYDGIVDSLRGMAQVYRDLAPDEIASSKEMEYETRRRVAKERLPESSLEAHVAAVEAEIQASVGDVRLDHQEGNSYSLKIEMKNGEETDALIRHRFEGTEDEDIYVDWIGESRPGQPPKGMEVFGMRGVYALRKQLREMFPDAKWISGNRAGGVHNEAVKTGKDHDPLIRLKLDPTFDGEPKNESQLLLLYGLGEFYNSNWQDQYEDAELDQDLAVALEEGYDDDQDVVFIEDMEDSEAQELIEYIKSDASKELDDVFASEEIFVDEIGDWGEKEWSLYGKKYGVENLGGMRPMKKHGKAELPGGGVEGTFTYQELLWIKAAAIDPEEAWTEEEHAQFQRKLAKTLTPDKDDTLGALNNLIFSMLSPSLNLTENEIVYSLIRIQNDEEVAEWAGRVPWDVTQGEVPSRAVYDRLEDSEKADFKSWLKTQRKVKVDPADMSDAILARFLRQFYDANIRKEFGIGAEGKGGIGIGVSADISHVAEIAQFYQVDPEWIMLGEGESWYHFVNRLQSQFGGLSAKTAAFGAVWQDPLTASIAAIDRHMAFVFREEIFTNPVERKKFEDEVFAKWKKRRGPQIDLFEPQSIDDIIQLPGGTGFVTKMLLDKISRPIKRKYDINKHSFDFIRDPEKLQLMSKHYLRALRFNAREARRLDLGVFAAQHLLWDRQRRRVEPHAVNFPGLYKLPKMTMNQLRSVLKKHKEYGFTSSQKVWVEDKDGGRELRLSRARSAPPGELAYASAAPGAYSEGTTRQGVANSLLIQPTANLNEDGGDMWVIDDETRWGWFVRKMQDSFRRVSQLQKSIERFTGATIRDNMDVYLYELLYHGRAADRINKFEKKYVEPLLDYLRENSIQIDKLEEHLHALHARERNKHLREIYYDRYKEHLETTIAGLEDELALAEAEENPTQMLRRRLQRMRRKLALIDNTAVPVSGMTDVEAAAIVEANGTRFDEAVALFRAMQEQKIANLREAGMIDDETIRLISRYKNYVPLKGKNHEGDLDELFHDTGLGSGRGFDVRGDELGYSYGRKEGDVHKNPILAQSILDVTKSIIRAEKNRVGGALLALVREYPNEDQWEVDKVVKRRVWSAKEQKVKFVEDVYAKQLNNVFAVNEDGETFYITIKDSRLASAMKNLGSEQIGPVTKLIGVATRLMAKVNTTFNAEFIVSNFIRDLQTAMVHLQDKDAQGLMAETMGNLPKALRGIYHAEFEREGENEWADNYVDFQKHGGQIGWTGYDDVLTMARDLQKQLNRQGPGARRYTMRQLMKLGRMIEGGNTVVENGIRLAAYQTAVNNGLSKDRAAALARRLTVNFNKKGEVGGVINAIWLFSNANIQGNARMLQAMWRSRRVRGIAGGMVLMGFLQAMLARGMGGDDEEDGYSYYEKMPDWIKETNHIIMLPGTKGDHLKLPMSYGYNVFFILGQQIENIWHKTNSGTFKASDLPKGGANFVAAVLSAFSPTGPIRMGSSRGMARPIVPSVAAPIFDTLVNETYYGAPIAPVRSSWDKSPESERYFQSVNETARKLSAWANKVTGGNAYQPGVVDVNPEMMEYVLGSYAGGGGQTAKRVLWDAPAWMWRSWQEDEMTKPEANDVAFLRRVYGEQNDHTVASVFYESAEEIEQAEAAWDNLRKDPNFNRRRWLDRHGWKRRLFDPLSEAQKKIRKAKTQEEKQRIRKEFNRRYRQVWLGQFD